MGALSDKEATKSLCNVLVQLGYTFIHEKISYIVEFIGMTTRDFVSINLGL